MSADNDVHLRTWKPQFQSLKLGQEKQVRLKDLQQTDVALKFCVRFLAATKYFNFQTHTNILIKGALSIKYYY